MGPQDPGLPRHLVNAALSSQCGSQIQTSFIMWGTMTLNITDLGEYYLFYFSFIYFVLYFEFHGPQQAFWAP